MPYKDTEVAKESYRRHYAENRTTKLDRQKQYNAENKEARNEYRRQWGKDHFEKNRQYGLIRRYGINSKDYDEILTKQNGRCAICNALPGARRLHVDHDHKTDEIRGLLCHGCNTTLRSDHDEEYYHKVIAYLNKDKLA